MPVKQPTEPTDEWMRRFLMSMTDDLYVELTEYVEHQVGRGQSIEGRKDVNEARALVHDVLVDTMLGIREWNPDGPIDLAWHIRRGVQSRMSHQVKVTKARRGRPLDLDQDGDNSTEIEVSLRADDERKRVTSRLHEAEVAQLLRDAIAAADRKADPDVMLLFDAKQVGLGGPREMERLHGWTLQKYKNVAKRLRRRGHKVPAEVKDLVKQLAVETMRVAAARPSRAIEADDDDPAGEDEDELSPESYLEDDLGALDDEDEWEGFDD
ncbi:MAG: hypothetical protein H6708_22360 [Kofleriaceae bacterium]|nr:hypothetical protein [Myxococcales bacterium]MCB9563150.1 hypothetical protein [Kofleriaceae bacterium]